eukprot:Nk52_evm3s330 gene=Nk52_evmTU3s330
MADPNAKKPAQAVPHVQFQQELKECMRSLFQLLGGPERKKASEDAKKLTILLLKGLSAEGFEGELKKLFEKHSLGSVPQHMLDTFAREIPLYFEKRNIELRERAQQLRQQIQPQHLSVQEGRPGATSPLLAAQRSPGAVPVGTTSLGGSNPVDASSKSELGAQNLAGPESLPKVKAEPRSMGEAPPKQLLQKVEDIKKVKPKPKTTGAKKKKTEGGGKKGPKSKSPVTTASEDSNKADTTGAAESGEMAHEDERKAAVLAALGMGMGGDNAGAAADSPETTISLASTTATTSTTASKKRPLPKSQDDKPGAKKRKKKVQGIASSSPLVSAKKPGSGPVSSFQPKKLNTMKKPAAGAPKLPGASLSSSSKPVQKKTKVFGGEKKSGNNDISDINNMSDVTVLAGVDLDAEAGVVEEEEEEAEYVKKDEKELDNLFLNPIPLQRHIFRMVIKDEEFKGAIDEVDVDAVRYLSEAVHERMKDIVENLILLSQHRQNDIQKTSFLSKLTQDTRKQLKMLEKIEKGKIDRQNESEQELLLKVSKSRSKGAEDAETAALREKAKQARHVEEEKKERYAANAAALAAIGSVKRKKKPPLNRKFSRTSNFNSASRTLSRSGSETGRAAFCRNQPFNSYDPSLPKMFTSGNMTPRGSFLRRGSLGHLQPSSMTKIALKDALTYLEGCEYTRKSMLLYESFLKLR